MRDVAASKTRPGKGAIGAIGSAQAAKANKKLPQVSLSRPMAMRSHSCTPPSTPNSRCEVLSSPPSSSPNVPAASFHRRADPPRVRVLPRRARTCWATSRTRGGPRTSGGAAACLGNPRIRPFGRAVVQVL